MPKGSKRKLTAYTKFIKKNMAEAIRTEGSAKAAMRKLARDWRNR